MLSVSSLIILLYDKYPSGAGTISLLPSFDLVQTSKSAFRVTEHWDNHCVARNAFSYQLHFAYMRLFPSAVLFITSFASFFRCA